MPNIAAPFAHEGTFRKGNSNLTYIATPEAIERLNVCFGYGNWSFRALESFRDGEFIVCRGELSIKVNGEWVTYCQYGGQQINRKATNKQTGEVGEIIDLADDYKGAASDAMKKCASHFGLGLYLSLKRQPTPWTPNEISDSGASPDPNAAHPAPLSDSLGGGEPDSVASPTRRVSVPPARSAEGVEDGDTVSGEPSAPNVDPLKAICVDPSDNASIVLALSSLKGDESKRWAAYKRQHGIPMRPEQYTAEDRELLAQFFGQAVTA